MTDINMNKKERPNKYVRIAQIFIIILIISICFISYYFCCSKEWLDWRAYAGYDPERLHKVLKEQGIERLCWFDYNHTKYCIEL